MNTYSLALIWGIPIYSKYLSNQNCPYDWYKSSKQLCVIPGTKTDKTTRLLAISSQVIFVPTRHTFNKLVGPSDVFLGGSLFFFFGTDPTMAHPQQNSEYVTSATCLRSGRSQNLFFTISIILYIKVKFLTIQSQTDTFECLSETIFPCHRCQASGISLGQTLTNIWSLFFSMLFRVSYWQTIIDVFKVLSVTSSLIWCDA